MDANVITISGLPPTYNRVKVKSLVQQQCNIDIINVEAGNKGLLVTLKRDEDVRVVHERLAKTVSFGGTVYPITISSHGKEVTKPVVPLLPVAPSTPKTSETVITCDTVCSWYEVEKLPSNKSGILVQDIPESVTPENIREHFESQEASHGGPVAHIRFMVDGIFVLFHDDSIAENVWKFRPHRICGEAVVIFLKLVPEVYEDTIVIQSGDIKIARLKEIIKQSSGQHEVKDVKMYPSRFVLATYENQLGVDELENIMRRFRSDHSDKVTLLPKTDCLRVERVGELSKDEIITLFENKDRTGGGPVTRLDRLKGNAALLYFASYKDVETIYKNFSANSLSIHGFDVKVFRYFHCLYDNHCNVLEENNLEKLIGKPGWPQHNFLYGVDSEVLEFLGKKKSHLHNLNSELNRMAAVTHHEDGLQVEINMEAIPAMNYSSGIMDAQHKCRRIIDRFLMRFTYLAFDDLKPPEKRILDNDHDIWAKRTAQNSGKVTIIGPKEKVEEYSKKLCKDDKFLNVSSDKKRWLIECKVIPEIENRHIVVTWNGSKGAFKIDGDREAVDEARRDINSHFQGLQRHRFVHADELVQKFLIEAREKEGFLREIQNILLPNGVKAIMTMENKAPCLFVHKNSLDLAADLMNGALSVESVEFDLLPPGITHTPGWKRIKSMEDRGLIITEVEVQSFNVKIAGFDEYVSEAKKDLQENFSENLLWVKKSYTTDAGKAKLLLQFNRPMEQVCEAKSVTYHDDNEEGIIVLEGKRKNVEKVQTALDRITERVAFSKVECKKPGIARFLRANEGKMILEESYQFETVVVIGNEASIGKGFQNSIEHLPYIDQSQEMELEIGALKITIMPGDITDVKTDAIVNCVLPTFELNKGVLSKAILKKAGWSIQNEITKAAGKKFRTTGGGNMPCRKIFHIVVNDEVFETLLSVLKRADKDRCSSLSLPAIGTGGAGYPVEDVAERMIGLFYDFAKDCPTPNFLKTIDIVIHDPTVMKKFLNVVSKLETGAARQPAKQRSTAPASSVMSHPSADALFPMTIGSLLVGIRKGNIVEEKNDAIVNSVGADFRLDAGMVSCAILQKAGQAIQNQLNNAHGVDIRVTNGINLKCKKVIHAVTTSTRDVKNCITDILHAAERNKCKSLSIPAIGTGKLRLPIDQCATLMLQAIMAFIEQTVQLSLKSLKKVDIVIYDEEQLTGFISGFYKANSGKTQKTTGGAVGGELRAAVTRQPSPRFTQQRASYQGYGQDPSPDDVTLYFYSFDSKAKDQAREHIKKKINDAYTEESLEDDVIAHLTVDMNHIERACFEKGVFWQRSGAKNKITVQGPSVYVTEALQSITGLIKDAIDAQYDGSNFIWQHSTSTVGWEAVDSGISIILEGLYKKSSDGQFSFKTDGKNLTVDFSRQTLDAYSIQRIQNDSKKGAMAGHYQSMVV